MEKKPCPVDRGKLLTGLEICLNSRVGCSRCPYEKGCCALEISEDALAYINYLEEQLNAKAGGSD